MTAKGLHFKAFIICSVYETTRRENISRLKQQLPGLKEIEAVYPSRQHVPFLKQLQKRSEERTGTRLNEGEIGVILSNRKIWRSIVAEAGDELEPYLILESDSCINDLSFFSDKGKQLAEGYDLFFFGGWMGHMQLKRSSRQHAGNGFMVGEPYRKTICSAYGYAVNKKAARYLLQKTARIQYPIDEFKKYTEPGELRIGAIVPELISELPGSSTIGHKTVHPVLYKLKMLVLDTRNAIICYFS